MTHEQDTDNILAFNQMDDIDKADYNAICAFTNKRLDLSEELRDKIRRNFMAIRDQSARIIVMDILDSTLEEK